MVKNDRILADERPFQHFLAILAHFMPTSTRIFEKGHRSVEVSERCVASTFLSFTFPSLFSPVWFLGSWQSKKPSFGVVPVKMGKSSGAIFSKIQVDIYIYIYIYSLKESEDGQLLTIKKLKNLIKNKNVSVLDLHQLHVTDEGLRPKRFYFLLNFLTF